MNKNNNELPDASEYLLEEHNPDYSIFLDDDDEIVRTFFRNRLTIQDSRWEMISCLLEIVAAIPFLVFLFLQTVWRLFLKESSTIFLFVTLYRTNPDTVQLDNYMSELFRKRNADTASHGGIHDTQSGADLLLTLCSSDSEESNDGWDDNMSLPYRGDQDFESVVRTLFRNHIHRIVAEDARTGNDNIDF